MANAPRELSLLFFALLFLSGCSSDPDRPGRASVIFTMRGFERAVHGCGDAEKSPHPCVSYRVTWPEVSEAVSTGAAQRMNHAIQDALRPDPPHADWSQEATILESAYADFQSSKFDNEVIFYHRRLAEVIRSTPAIISISITDDRFLGVEAPEFRQNFLNFDPRTGEIIHLTDILAPGAAIQLRRYEATPATPFAPAPEGLFLANEPRLAPLLIPWPEAAALFPAGSPIVPPAERYTKR